MDAKITNSNENKANPVNYSTQGFTGDPRFLHNLRGGGIDYCKNRKSFANMGILFCFFVLSLHMIIKKVVSV